MSQPVKLSDALVLDARLAAEAQERSIAGQVEFWAKLGRSVDALLKGPQVSALHRSARAESLSERLASVDSPAGRARAKAYLQTRLYPHYKEAAQSGLLIRVDEDGTETVGRFVNREFVASKSARPQPKSGGKRATVQTVLKTRKLADKATRLAKTSQ